MFRVRSLRHYFLCFFLSGHSSYIPFSETKKTTRFWLYLPRISMFLLLVWAAIIFGIELKVHKLLRVQHSLYLMLFVHASGLTSSICHENAVKRILLSFNRAIDHLEMALNIRVQINCFEKTYRRKFVFIVCLIVLFYIARIPVVSENFSSTIDVLLLLMNSLKVLAVLQVILLIDLIGFLMCTMNDLLRPAYDEDGDVCLALNSYEIIRVLRNLKTVHFKLWELSQTIAQRFGWFLLMFVLESFCTTVFAVFGGFTVLKTLSTSIALLRKH